MLDCGIVPEKEMEWQEELFSCKADWGNEMEKDIQEKVVKAVQELMGASARVWLQETVRDNGESCKVIHISEGQSLEESNIFIEQMLHEIRTGEMTIKDAATEIVGFHTEQLHPELFYGITKALAKQRILDCVVYQLISLEKNTEYLENRPHRKFLDFAVIYRVILQSDNKKITSFVITDAVCNEYSISKEELEIVTGRNTKDYGFSVRTLNSFLSGESQASDAVESTILWVCTTNSCIFGASILLYEEYFVELADTLETDLYLLPVNTHVILATPADCTMLHSLKEIVVSMHDKEGAMEDELNNNVYLYCRRTHEISIA